MANNANPALVLEVGDQREQDSRGFVLWWVIATSVGLVTGGAVAAMVEAAMRRSLYRDAMPESEQVLKSMLNVGLMVSVSGAFIGANQWLVFRRRLSHSGWWVPAAVAGWGMAGAFSGGLSALFQDVTPSMSDVSAASVAVSLIPFFLMPGVFQWLALRRRFDNAVQWLWWSHGALFLGLVGALAVVRGGLVTVGWLTPYDFPSVNVFVLFGLVTGPIYGAVTGFVIVRLLRQQRPSHDRGTSGQAPSAVG
jgi:hypothetical protein